MLKAREEESVSFKQEQNICIYGSLRSLKFESLKPILSLLRTYAGNMCTPMLFWHNSREANACFFLRYFLAEHIPISGKSDSYNWRTNLQQRK